MKILLAAPQDKTVLGAIGRSCRRILVGLGHEIEIFDFRQRPYAQNKVIAGMKSGIRALLPFVPSPYEVSGNFRRSVDIKINQLLERLAQRFCPDLVLVLCGENIFPETLDKIRRQTNPVLVNWFHDTILLPYRQELLERIAWAYDILFLVDDPEVLGHVKLNARRVETLPLGFDPTVHRKVELSAPDKMIYGSDIAFIGTVTTERQAWLEQLSSFDLTIWGRWTGKSRLLKPFYRKKDVYGAEAVKIYNASKIILDFHSLWNKVPELYNVTPRLFEVPASGGFLLTNPSVQLSNLFSIGEEIVVYRDLYELKDLLNYYLAHQDLRLAIAERGYRKTQRCHSLEHRLKELLDKARSVS